jgi:flagellar motility protein MotE (MotC chaperone)
MRWRQADIRANDFSIGREGERVMDNDGEKSSYGTLERFIYILLLPILFTAILTGVLLTLFDYDVKNVVYSIGRNIPIINNIVPEEQITDTGLSNPANESIQLDQQIKDLSATSTEKDTQIAKLESDLKSRDDQIAQLEASVEKLVLDQESIATNSEDYRKQLKSLASMYAGMTTSKSAPILENLTMPELVLVLYEMSSGDQGRVLEKMNPKTAADASIQLKDVNELTRKNWEEKARIARDEKTAKEDPEATTKLTNAELAQTFSAMTVASAADILLQLNKSNSTKVVSLLNAMDNTSRSNILAAIATISPGDAAALANKLGK